MTGGASTPTLWAVTPERIQEAMRRIVQTAHPRAVLLFGSHARGDAKPHSDIDLMVLEEGPADPAAEAVRLREAVGRVLMAIDIVVVTREQFEYWKDTPGNVYYEAAQDGRTLYEAD